MKPDTPRHGANSNMPGLHETESNARHEVIRADVARRLRNACNYLTDEEFAVLVDKIVGVQLRAERRQRKPLA